MAARAVIKLIAFDITCTVVTPDIFTRIVLVVLYGLASAAQVIPRAVLLMTHSAFIADADVPSPGSP